MLKIKKVLIIFIVCLIAFSFYGCNKNLTNNINSSLSEVRFNLFEAKNETINIKFSSGFREDPYILNGKSENKKEFGIITIKFLTNISNKNSLPSFVITINDIDFDGEFELNPFDQTYVQDIETYVLDDSKIFIKINWNDIEYEGELINLSNSFNCNYSKALNIFVKQYYKNIKSFMNNNISFETYVKIINDPSLEIDKNYFYVCLITTQGESLSLIIDPFSCEILVKNESKNQVIL